MSSEKTVVPYCSIHNWNLHRLVVRREWIHVGDSTCVRYDIGVSADNGHVGM